MLRHEFRPGKLVAGGFFTLAGVIYAGDAGGAWETPWFAVLPLVVIGLCLAGITAAVASAVRRRRVTSGGNGGFSDGPDRPTEPHPGGAA